MSAFDKVSVQSDNWKSVRYALQGFYFINSNYKRYLNAACDLKSIVCLRKQMFSLAVFIFQKKVTVLSSLLSACKEFKIDHNLYIS